MGHSLRFNGNRGNDLGGGGLMLILIFSFYPHTVNGVYVLAIVMIDMVYLR